MQEIREREMKVARERELRERELQVRKKITMAFCKKENKNP